jgi:hypothetical protein
MLRSDLRATALAAVSTITSLLKGRRHFNGRPAKFGAQLEF